MNWLIENWNQIIELLLAIVGVASIAASLTPNKTDNEVVAMIRKVIDTIGFNVGNAKNKDE